MNDNQLLRYSRHILLNQIAFEGQEILTKSHALIVGAGGLGSAAALYLAAAGVGKITICDFDDVELSNLQRQIIHTSNTIGMNKAISAKQALQAINPEVVIDTICQKSSIDDFSQLINSADVVLDCSDNFATRYALNRLCVTQKKPLVSGAAIGFEGQITVYDKRDDSSPCYHCLFPDNQDDSRENNDQRCADHGVFSPLVGMIGTTQAAEALKLLMHIGESLQGRLLMLDALCMEWHTIKLKRDPACLVCANT